jgi:hypothetical protein
MIVVGKWCAGPTRTARGRRYSLDVNADSSYDAAHLFLTHGRTNPSCGFPIPTTATQFEVVTGPDAFSTSPARDSKTLDRAQLSLGCFALGLLCLCVFALKNV